MIIKTRNFLTTPFLILITLLNPLHAESTETRPNLHIKPKIYYGNNSESALSIDIPVRAHTIFKIKLFENIISYRNDKKAHIDFTLPYEISKNTSEIEMLLEAYNDDSQYVRAIWFEVDGIGGYLGVTQVEPGQYIGNVTLAPKQKKQWKLDLSKVYVSKKKDEQLINFTDMLKKPGPHTISCWISTYGQYGPQSWVSIELIFK